MKNIRMYLFSYNYQGSEYSLEIPANSLEEAKGRLSQMVFAQYDGELVAKVPANSSSGILVNLAVWIRNRIKLKT